ncbi:putative MSHA biogenesis protein MshP [Vibrio nigripulchritudo SFn27]|uniref:Putative MSHA biogenesis protein MshP n=1 Tax=Vibrio nigripulchritudo TaxID=28173 RepID=U4K180_9VIBR|nr:MSHA biogenesis protein MshP [Vibrio nigripulchritudo]CCN83274.1 putative MSHA biogenesis protein MshP [Vibrio nigripulchritudo BLFn1]CCN86784.1 putative MSHA biogenesis protein MshP [Vibrio nigripulchritudo SFn27]CCN95399.1 putative MSHA biogenesis protein MshP [Vibrio nigripulchritudo ENn2]CCO41556.1 putative MSHA biogenesis protein MshP [Vibrio nigripulchritudo SFn135]CCO53531.1 putative MSHA biogenesis protein MshP [Vibrio nigripulchritudo Wn13]
MSPKSHQSGSVLIIAIFVIVVMGMLGLTLIRLEWSNQDTLTREVLGTQAWFLAHSGNEWGLTYMYPLNESAAVSNLDTRCTSLDTDAVAAASAIRQNADAPCSSLIIECEGSGSGDLRFYRISSVAVCGSTTFEVSREQEVWAKSME